jgi:hypothetical protein
MDPQDLYRGRKGKVDFVDVPELGYLVIDGRGAPDETEGPFQRAIQTLFKASYAAHFGVRKTRGEAPRVMPIEALWWVEGPDPADFDDAAPEAWRWRAQIMQPPPIDREVVAGALRQLEAKDVPGLADLRYELWEEGRCAQTLHVGPYDAEGPAIAALHQAICRAGCHPRGRHHEIYLGDPRRSAPERLRTLIRQPVETDEENDHG